MAFLSNLPVMYFASENGYIGSKYAFDELEKHMLHKLKGRKFYGVFQPATDEYRACVSRISTDDPNWFGLKTWVIASGKYFRIKIAVKPKKVSERKKIIGKLLEEYSDRMEKDRPVIEYFRGDDLILYLPK